jgi:hypothetical protein
VQHDLEGKSEAEALATSAKWVSVFERIAKDITSEEKANKKEKSILRPALSRLVSSQIGVGVTALTTWASHGLPFAKSP